MSKPDGPLAQFQFESSREQIILYTGVFSGSALAATNVVALTWFAEDSWILTDLTHKEKQPCTNTLFWAIILSVWEAVLQITQNILPPDVVVWDLGHKLRLGNFGHKKATIYLFAMKARRYVYFSSWAIAPVWVSFSPKAVTNLQQNTTSWSLSHFLRMDPSKRCLWLTTWKLSLRSFHGKYCTIKDGTQTYDLNADKKLYVILRYPYHLKWMRSTQTQVKIMYIIKKKIFVFGNNLWVSKISLVHRTHFRVTSVVHARL